VEPELVCEVRYKEWTADPLLRQPVFVRFRDDKPLDECVLPGGADRNAGEIVRDDLADEAFAMDMRKLVLTHPLTDGVGDPSPPEIQKELADKGAFIEHCFVATTRSLGELDPQKIVEAIRYVGIEKCILSTDFGQAENPKPAEGMSMMVDAMLGSGLQEEELEILLKRNPAMILNLE